jgi:23S rRNA pseudouridine2605 synthase
VAFLVTPAGRAEFLMGERIQKVLARAGVASRRQVEEWIKAGRLAINGVPATLGAQLRPRDKVTLDGRAVRLREPESAARIVVYHRTPGRELTPSESAESGRLFDKLPKRAGRRWVPISPLPPHDGGLELLTSDGDLAQSLMRRLTTLRVVFAVRVRGVLNEQQRARLQSGVIDDESTLEVESIEAAGGEGTNRWYTLSTRGARARDVHRLVQAAGFEVSRLMRIGLGPIRMDRALGRERFRALNPGETAQVYESAGMAPAAAPPTHSGRPASRVSRSGRNRSTKPARTNKAGGRQRATRHRQ